MGREADNSQELIKWRASTFAKVLDLRSAFGFGETASPLFLRYIVVSGERSSAWLEHKIVDLGVAGSNPVARPNINEKLAIAYQNYGRQARVDLARPGTKEFIVAG